MNAGKSFAGFVRKFLGRKIVGALVTMIWIGELGTAQGANPNVIVCAQAVVAIAVVIAIAWEDASAKRSAKEPSEADLLRSIRRDA